MARIEGSNVQIRAIAKAVATAFASSELNEEDKAPGQIVHTNLPWSRPPLKTDLRIQGMEVQSLLDMPVSVKLSELLGFWESTLADMWNTPGSCIRKGSYARLAKLLPFERYGSRAHRFAVPVGYPGSLDEMAGVMFSLEVAHLAFVSLPVVDLVSDDDNYYVVLKDGTNIGVRDGKPACTSEWIFDASGMVQVMLETYRGEAEDECAYDQIALLRSILWEHRARFKDFDALDMLLQALRFMTLEANCPDLIHQMRQAPEDLREKRERIRLIKESIEVMSADIPDRSKLYTLQTLLVPRILSAVLFKKHIFSSPEYPFTMEIKKAEKIKEWLAEALEREDENAIS